MTTAKTIQQVHWQTLLRSRGELVSYDTGTEVLSDINVVVTRPSDDQVNLVLEGSVNTTAKQWDVLIDPESLVDSSDAPLIPAPNHQIIRADGTRLLVAERPSEKKTVWRWSDALKTWRRVFCQEVS